MRTNLRYKVAQIKNAIFGVDLDVVSAYQHKLPKTINVEVGTDGKYLYAVVKEINGQKIGQGFATQGKNFDDLVLMVNDAVQTYLDIPPEICAQMPVLLPDNYESIKKTALNQKTLKFARA